MKQVYHTLSMCEFVEEEEELYLLFLLLLLCFNVLGTNRGPTDRIQHINKHSSMCQVDTIDFLSKKHSLNPQQKLQKASVQDFHCFTQAGLHIPEFNSIAQDGQQKGVKLLALQSRIPDAYFCNALHV